MAKNYWLLKSEPTAYSIDDLKRDGSTDWTGIRNYQARNTIRDQMQRGDLAFFYHSGTDVKGIYGICKIASDAFADPTALDNNDDHYDPRSTSDNPIWYARRVTFSKKFTSPISLETLRGTKGLEKMALLQKGSRLSVQPVSESEWDIIIKLGGK
jgi:predicted RNA-binding protein with PUA-like domain